MLRRVLRFLSASGVRMRSNMARSFMFQARPPGGGGYSGVLRVTAAAE